MARRKKKPVLPKALSEHGPIRSPAPPLTPSELQADLEEIRRMGLIDRAIGEFKVRVPNATIQNLAMGYFKQNRREHAPWSCGELGWQNGRRRISRRGACRCHSHFDLWLAQRCLTSYQ